MKYLLFLCVFVLGIGAKSQYAILESGDWCNENYTLKLNSDLESADIQWKKDGEPLADENKTSINCSSYGKGNYTVVFKVEGIVHELSHDISDVEGPQASFKATNYLAAAVTFFEDQSISTDEIIAWNWDFGNGEVSSEQHPRIMYAEQKVYTITLTITTASGCKNTMTLLHEWAYK